MNDDLISRATLIEEFEDYPLVCASGSLGTAHDLLDVVRNVPAIDAEPVQHGEWAHLGGDEWCCTECGEVIHTEGSWEKPTRKYCHECGAKMYVEVEDAAD